MFMKTEIEALTALTAGGNKEAEIATPTKDPILPPRIDKETPAPDGKAMKTPTHKLCLIPLEKILKNIRN